MSSGKYGAGAGLFEADLRRRSLRFVPVDDRGQWARRHGVACDPGQICAELVAEVL